MAKKFNHAEWERWCADWNVAGRHKEYPAFSDYASAESDKGESDALDEVITQAVGAGDMKMVRNVYYHAPYGSAAKRRSLDLIISYAVKTGDALLARDAWQQAGCMRDVQQKANRAYEQITGEPYSN